MVTKSSVFEKTYKDYLDQIARIDVKSIEGKLGVQVEGNGVLIPLFGKPHRVSGQGITDQSGQKPSFDICVILCKYLLLCPDGFPKGNEWASFRELKNAGPLTGYFVNNVERQIALNFSGKLRELEQAGKILGGYPPDIELSYDLSTRFGVLPRVPLFMFFNDADDEFPAECSVLFEKRAEYYLDAECLAMVGRLLFVNLRKAGEKSVNTFSKNMHRV